MKKIPLHVQIFAGMGLGLVAGLSLNLMAEAGTIDRSLALSVGRVGEWFGVVFLTLLSMIVVPLIVASIISSLTGVGSNQGVGRLGGRTVAYYLLTSLLAITVGIIVVNIVQPGAGLDYNELMAAAQGELETRGMQAKSPAPGAAEGGITGIFADIVLRMIPKNVVDSSRSNTTILAVIFFSVLFGVSAVAKGGETAKTVDGIFRSFYEVMITMTNGILHFAPIGIAGYVLFVTATTGLQLAGALAWYMLAVALGLAFHAFVTLPLLLKVITGRSPLTYAYDMRDALLTAFSTASSSGTLPLTIQCATDKAKVPERVASFTLPLGATVNMDGTALYEVAAVLFIAQMLGDLTLMEQGVVAVTALMASVGAAGIPHAGTVMMVVVMQAVNLPTDAVLVILAVDRVLDMARTTVNVWSDSIGAAIIAHFEQ
ncbi:MAG: dicarboxylate/amino acid:cation symporter [Myxococcales bacterium]|nr:dicarboxylate/amino acid:cation symporter [Myxococcales bacterium]